MKFLPLLLLSSVFAAGLAVASAGSNVSDDTVESRLKPVGHICMEGQVCAAAPTVASSTDSGPRSGQVVFATKCMSCHATGAAGAPKLGDVAAWSPRVAQGLEQLYTHAINGFNGMPAKGLCFDCSDDEIKGAVNYMVDNSK